MTSIKNTKFSAPSLRKSLLAVAVTSFLITGCGSSSDDKSSSSAASINGVASKGIVSNGIVTAYLLGSDGVKGDVVGTSMTDSKGNYTLSTNESYDGVSPLLLELTAGEGTEMACDSFDGCGTVIHGEAVALADSDFVLTSVIPGTGSDADVSASITAFTSIAASNIVASGSVTDTSILETTSKINQVVGVNILETAPVDAASEAELTAASVDSQRYSIMLAALATQAFDETASVDEMMANLDSFNADFDDDTIGNDEGGLSLIDLYTDANAASEAASDSLSESAIAEIATLSDSVVGQLDDNGNFTPSPTTVTDTTDVAQAKAFVTEIRTWASNLQDLESPAELFLDEADTLSETLGSHSEAVLEVYANAMGTAIDAISEAIDTDAAVPMMVDVYSNDDQLIGSVSILDNSTADSTQYVLAGTDLTDSAVSVAATIALNHSLDADTIAAGDTTFSINSVVSDSDVQITLAGANLTMGFAESLTIDADDEPELSGMSISGGLSIEALDGGVATGEMIAANAELKYVALDASLDGSLDNDINVGLEKIALNNLSVVNDAGETAGLSLSLTINNPTSVDSLAFINDLAEETNEAFLNATLSVSGTITLADTGEAILSITGNRTGLDAGNMTATLGYAGKSLQLTAETTNGEEDGTDAKLTFSNADGVALTVEENEDWTSGVVTVGDTTVGTIEGDSIIRYSDGTFESL